MARKGILSSDISKQDRPIPNEKPIQRPRGAVGALQSSLSKLQENAVQEISADLIDDAGVEDRLGIDPAAQNQLKESLATYGQQVPVLLRPNSKRQGRFEIVYGRRRLAALKDLGLPVKAMVRQLDDHDLVMAQGQENTARQDLSFIEKASFAAQLQQLDYDRQTIAAALSVDLPMVSRLLKVGTAFPLPFLRDIGSAPTIGRDRWLALATALSTDDANNRANALMKTSAYALLNSDARFEAVFERATEAPKLAKAKAAKPRTLRDTSGKALGDIKSGPRGVTLNIPSRISDGFDVWVATHAESLLQDLHIRWKNERTEDK